MIREELEWLGSDLPCRRPDRDPDMWHSDDPDEREEAADICRDECGFKKQCLQLRLAVKATHGVWGGKEFAAKKSRPYDRTCPHGHPWVPENTGHNPAGRRYCRVCAGEIRLAELEAQPTLFDEAPPQRRQLLKAS